FFHGESPGYVHYSQHVNHQTHPITEVRKYYLVSDLATGQGVDHLDAYSKFRPVTGDGECFYRSFIFSYLVIN
uniref:ubiquitinyl hydrolase 1 n=1 Tax=Aegilops tauschii subsp. strangulata TaxID=200361 RepID=A0A453GJ43_AEGTS